MAVPTASWRRLLGGLLFGVLALVLLVGSGGSGELAHPVVRYGVTPTMALVALVNVALGVGRPSLSGERRILAGRTADAVAILGMLAVSLLAMVRNPEPVQVFYAFRWTLVAVVLVALLAASE